MSEIFHREFPYYLAMGMTYDLYWHGDASLPRDYLKASLIKRKLKNEENWRIGRYVYEAILSASPILRDFAPKGTKAYDYLDEPFPLTKKDVEEKIERKKRQEYQAEIEKMKLRANEWNAKFKGGGNDG